MEGLEIVGDKIYWQGYLVAELVEGAAPATVAEEFSQMLQGWELVYEDPTY